MRECTPPRGSPNKSCVLCHMSPVSRHMSCISSPKSQRRKTKKKQSGEASWWRVCYHVYSTACYKAAPTHTFLSQADNTSQTGGFNSPPEHGRIRPSEPNLILEDRRPCPRLLHMQNIDPKSTHQEIIVSNNTVF